MPRSEDESTSRASESFPEPLRQRARLLYDPDILSGNKGRRRTDPGINHS